MFVYQTKINGKDGLVGVSQTQDSGNQVPVFGVEVLTVSEVSNVLKEQTLVLTKDGETQKYTVKFTNYDNSVLQTSQVAYGETPVYSGETPTKPDDETYTYTFKAWSPAISTVTGDQTHKATFNKTEK